MPDILEDGRAAFGRARHDLWLEAGGLLIHVRSAIAELLDAPRAALKGAEPGQADLTILLATDDDGLLDRPPRWSFPYFPEAKIEARLGRGPYLLHHFDDIGFWQFYDCDARFGLQVAGPGRRLPAWDSGSPLRSFIQWTLVGRGAGLVHGGVLGAAGRAMLLTGEGGSGKSGTVLAGVMAGLATVGDDYVAIRPGDPPVALRVFETMKQDPAGCARVGLDPQCAALNWQGKHLIRLDRVSPRPLPDALPLSVIGLPKITHAAKTTARPATSKEAFLAMVPSGIKQVHGARAQMFSLCADLSRDLPAVHIDLGTDPAEVAEAIGSLLEGQS